MVVDIVEAFHSAWFGGAWAFVAPDVYFLPAIGAMASSLLVKNQSCFGWGVSRLGNDGAPWDLFLCASVSGTHRHVPLVVCYPS